MNRAGRVEDYPLVTGTALFTEDLTSPDALHIAFVRTPFAHARLGEINAARALSHPEVVGVYGAGDLKLAPLPPTAPAPRAFARPALAEDVVRFVGEAVAVVVAESRAAAVDAAELVAVEFEPLEPVIDPERAAGSGAPLLFPGFGSNVAAKHRIEFDGDVLGDAEVRVRARFINQRLAAVPLEGQATLAVPEAGGGVTLWTPCQAQFPVRSVVAECIGIPEGSIRVASPAVGGGFGAKIVAYPEQVISAALALRLGRAVRYVETRSENLVAMTHGRAQIQDVELGATRDGRLTGLRVRVVADLGAYASEAADLPNLTGRVLSGVYRIPKIDFHAVGVVTNTTPVSAYRGAGRPEATTLLERIVDMMAGELELDPVEVRRRNLIPNDAFPYRTATGAVYDSGNYEGALSRALELARYEELREEQTRRRTGGDVRQLGIGVSTYVEGTGGDHEYACIAIGRDGTPTVLTGVSPHGQGHETSFARLVGETLRLPPGAVRVVHSDTAAVARGEGTMASRSLQIGGSAVLRAAEAVLEKARAIAGRALEVGEDDLTLFEDGRIGVVGSPATALEWGDMARLADGELRSAAGGGDGLRAEVDFEADAATYPFGAHVAVVEVDTETGAVEIVRYIAVDDCGRVLNPAIVEGQVHGGLAQGIGQALAEGYVYDEIGNPLTASLATYGILGFRELPSFETERTETPTFHNPLGVKGIGESGTIGSAAAVQNAVVDALRHFGVRHIDMPLTPERVWRTLHPGSEDLSSPHN